MRLLFVTNYYPPHHIGGYELHCARVAEWLGQTPGNAGAHTGTSDVSSAESVRR
jgi:hypothetical protein